jgi:hypothetical protein
MTPAHRSLLLACLVPGGEMAEDWKHWRAEASEPLDDASARLLPLAHKNLGSIAGPAASNAYKTSWLANIELVARMEEALVVLHAAGLRTLVLKGVALALLHYRDLGARTMSDCDVLVPEAEAQAAWDSLKSAGWRAGPNGPDDWPPHEKHAGILNHPAKQMLDLHRHAIYACQGPGDDDGFWSRSVPVVVGRVTARALGSADQLLHTFAHGLRWSMRPQVHWIADAVTIIRSSGSSLAWDTLYEEAERRRLMAVVADGCATLEDVIPGVVPPAFLERLFRKRAPWTDRVEQWYATRPPDGLLGTLPSYWFIYVRSCRAAGTWPGPVGFARSMARLWGGNPLGLRRTLMRKVASRTRSLLNRDHG